MTTRRDKLGRRIGRNWWREWTTDVWRTADHAWWLAAEAEALGYATELAEYRAAHPRPTFKATLMELSGRRADGHPYTVIMETALAMEAVA